MLQKRLCLTLASLVCAWGGLSNAGTITVSSTVIGITPQNVGFSQGDYVAGTNTNAWVDYSNANAFRIWSSPDAYPTEVASYTGQVTTVAQLDARKLALRTDLLANPDSTTYVNWTSFKSQAASKVLVGSNQLSLDYALGALNTRNIHVIEQISRTVSHEVTDWSGKWEQWQAFYAQAYYEAHNYNVSQFQIYNEPDISAGETSADLLVRMQLASDAIHSAIADVNAKFGKNLVASVAGPTQAHSNFTTGSFQTAYQDWGKTLLAGNRTDYAGRPTTYDNFDTYDFHLYTPTTSLYTSDVNYLKTNVPLDNASHNSMPVILSELNYENTSTFASNGNTLNQPNIVAGLAANLIGLASVNTAGLYAFKFSQTPYNGPNGVIPQPTGFYYLDTGAGTNNTGNITGSTLGAEAYRLFAKGFKGARNRVSTSAAQTGGTYNMAATVDPATNTYYAYATNTSTSSNAVTLDLSGWNVQPGALVTIEEASARRFGEVSSIVTVPANKMITFTQPGTSVDLVTVPQGTPQHIIPISASDSVQVRYNASVSSSKTTNYATAATASVSRSTASTGDNFATYLKFNLAGQNFAGVSRAILQMTGKNATNSNVATFEVYGILNNSWNASTITWATAPDLGGTTPTLTGVGTDAFPVGHLSFDGTQSTSMLDVTPFVSQYGAGLTSFVLVREQQFGGEADDGNRVDLLTRSSLTGAPQLLLFSSAVPEPSSLLAVAALSAIALLRRRL